MQKQLSLEIIMPVYNEEAGLQSLFKRLEEVFSPEAQKQNHLSNVKLTFVNDGSRDRSAEIIQRYLDQKKFSGQLINFSRNFGHQPAVSAGMFHSTEDIVAIIDSDLQDPPEVILKMIEVFRAGYDVVYGVRRKRKENFIKRFCYWAFYRFYKAMSPINVPLDSGDFCIMSRRVVAEMNKLPEHIRFPRGLRSWVGFAQTGLEYERASRLEGESKYKFSDLYKLATHGVTALSTRPLQFTQILATVYVLFSVLWLIFLFTNFAGNTFLSRDSLIILIFVSFSNALIMGTLHLHGAYLGRGYTEIKRRPCYIVAEIVKNS